MPEDFAQKSQKAKEVAKDSKSQDKPEKSLSEPSAKAISRSKNKTHEEEAVEAPTPKATRARRAPAAEDNKKATKKAKK